MKIIVAVVTLAFYDETAPKQAAETASRLADALDILDGEVISLEVTSAQNIPTPDPDLDQGPLSWAVGAWRRDAQRIAADMKAQTHCCQACGTKVTHDGHDHAAKRRR